jgi:hypothetical protein
MEKLLKSLYQEGVIQTELVYNSMLQIDRADFTNNAYEDRYS